MTGALHRSHGVPHDAHPIRELLLLAGGLFAVQAGFHGFTAALPVALAHDGMPDPDIGLIVGFGSVAQIPSALVIGALIDRVGTRRVFLLGAAGYLAGALIMMVPALGMQVGPLLVARGAQGMGSIASQSAAFAHVPRLVAPSRQGLGLAVLGTAQSLTFLALTPLSLVILSSGSLGTVALVMAILTLVGSASAWRPLSRGRSRTGSEGPGRTAPAPASAIGGVPLGADPQAFGTGPPRRRLGLAFRRAWLAPLLVNVAFMIHWGVILAFLSQRMEAAGADVGAFFMANGLAMLVSRIPAGWVADRVPAGASILVGLAFTALVIVAFTWPPETATLIVVAMVSAGSGALVFTPTLVELTRRSGEADRGSAVSMFAASLAAGVALGSLGGAPIVARFGFEGALYGAMAGVIVAAVVALADWALRARRPSAVGIPEST